MLIEIMRSGAMRLGSLRTDSQRIGSRSLRIIFSVLMLFMIACSRKAETPKREAVDLTRLLPKETFAFGTVNASAKGFTDYLRSPAYQKYLESLRKQLSRGMKETGDFTTYFEVLDAMGVMKPGEDNQYPYSGGLFFVASKSGENVPATGAATAEAASPLGTIAAAVYYEAAPGTDPRIRLGAIRDVLAGKKVPFAAINGENFEGFSITIFKAGEEIPPALRMYRDVLGITEAFVGANDGRLVISTSRDLLNRGFSPPTDGMKPFMESDAYRRALAALPASESSIGFGAADLEAIARRIGGSMPLPFAPALMRFEATGNGTMIASAIPVDPKDDRQRELLGLFAAPSRPALSGATLFARVPDGSAVGISLDGELVSRVIDLVAKSTPLPPDAGAAMTLLRSVGMIHLGIGKAVVPRPMAIPEITLAIQSTDAPKLLEGIRALLPADKLPPGMTITETTVNGSKVYSLPTPLGVMPFLGQTGDTVYLTTIQSVFSSSAAPALPIRVPEKAALGMTRPRAGVYLDYALIADLAGDAMKSFAATLPPGTALDAQGYEYMRNGGKIVISVDLADNILRINFVQEFQAS